MGTIKRMLPRRRVWSVLLLGVAAMLAVVAAFSPLWMDLKPRLALSAEDLTWTLHDDSAQVADLDSGEVVTVPATQQLHVQLEEPADEDSITARVGLSVLRDGSEPENERLYSAEVWNYVVDRVTGEGVEPAVLNTQIASTNAQVDVDGSWWKFPTAAPQEAVALFDPQLREARDADFVAREELSGSQVYHYRQIIDPTNLATLYSGLLLTSQDEDGQALYLYYQTTRDVWVEPETGLVVKAEEDTHLYYADREGEKREVQLAFHGTMDDSQVEHLLSEAHRMQPSAVWAAVPWVAGLAAVVLAVLALVGLFRGGAQPHGHRDAGEEARDAAQARADR